jgi:hypothetical protein
MEKPKRKLRQYKYKLVIAVQTTQYRYITASSVEEAKKRWDDGTWEEVEYDFDESYGMDELKSIVKIK